MTMPSELSRFPVVATGTEADDEYSTGQHEDTRARIRDVKNQVVDQAKDTFRQAKESAGTSLDRSRLQAADRIGGLAGAVRTTGRHLRSENQAGVADVAESLADQADRISSYLHDKDLNAVRNDVESFARRRPGVAVGVALALGILGARFFKSSKPAGIGGGRG